MNQAHTTTHGAGRPLAMVTGASTGIGYELARQLAIRGYDLVVAADEPRIEEAAARFRGLGRAVTAVEADLSTPEGVERLLRAAAGRQVDLLCANAGRALGHAFLDQDWRDVRGVIDTNVTGTLLLLQRVARDMAARGEGRILVTGSLVDSIPGPFQAVYNASKAFLGSFTAALREELKGSGVTLTTLMPGATDTEVFRRAGMADTLIGETSLKEDPANVAEQGLDALMRGEAKVVTGIPNKVLSALAQVTPEPILSEIHRVVAKPRDASDEG